jgi:hypothetical protein
MIDDVLYVQDENIVDEIENEEEEEEDIFENNDDNDDDNDDSQEGSEPRSGSIRSVASGDSFASDDEYNHQED